MRRRNAASIRSAGCRLVENISSTSNGKVKLAPVLSFMKSTWFSIGTIQRLSRSFGANFWRPKSSISIMPLSALTCSGAS